MNLTKTTNTIGKGLIALAIFLWLVQLTNAQTPTAAQTDKPATPITLSPEASRQFLEIEKEKAALIQKFELLNLKQQLVLADEGVAKSERDRQWSVVGDVVVMQPKPVKETPKP